MLGVCLKGGCSGVCPNVTGKIISKLTILSETYNRYIKIPPNTLFFSSSLLPSFPFLLSFPSSPPSFECGYRNYFTSSKAIDFVSHIGTENLKE